MAVTTESRSDVDKWYRNYWERLRAREALYATLRAPVLFWSWSDGLNEVETFYFTFARDAGRILDFGAGDERLKRKFEQAGFAGQYDTVDLSPEHPHTHDALTDLQGPYDVIFCLEVIEHISLNEYVDLMDGFQRLLRPGGTLIVSTPNPLCIVPMWSLDAGHVQQFPLADLVADLVVRGYDIKSTKRMRLGARPRGLARLRFLAQRALCYLLSVDYAHSQIVVATKSSHVGNRL